jgi:hypothetical protein
VKLALGDPRKVGYRIGQDLPPPRKATIAVLGLRIAYGVMLVAAPERVARRWLGAAAGTAATQVPLRGLGAREVVLHGGAFAAACSGAPLRPWLAGSIAGDLADIAATAAGRDQLPQGAVAATLLVAGGSALLSATLAAALDR